MEGDHLTDPSGSKPGVIILKAELKVDRCALIIKKVSDSRQQPLHPQGDSRCRRQLRLHRVRSNGLAFQLSLSTINTQSSAPF